MLKSPASRGRALTLAVMALFLSAGACRSQDAFEDVRLVDSPTAGILPHGSYMIQGSVGPENSIVAGLGVGFFDRLMLGVSYGFQKFIGRGDISANDRPGFEIRLRLIEESDAGPALALGIDTQGEDYFDDAAERYDRKSKGAYAAVSKNYRLIEDFSVHGGINYSFETEDERGVNAFGGFSLDVMKGFGIVLDYNAALDDNDGDVPSSRTKGKGYLDSGLFFEYGGNLRMKFFLKDLLNNYEPASGVERSVEIFYYDLF